MKHPSGKLGIPMVYGGKYYKNGTSVDDIMEMSNYKVGIMYMNVEWDLG